MNRIIVMTLTVVIYSLSTLYTMDEEYLFRMYPEEKPFEVKVTSTNPDSEVVKQHLEDEKSSGK